MKGRRVDTDFLSAFITECVSNNKFSTDDIVSEAKSRVNSIDEKIKEVENLKSIRCKLLDVVMTFEKNDLSNKITDSKILEFFNIQNSHICKFICDNMKNSAVKIDSLYGKDYSIQDIIFCTKQLLEHKVISKSDNYLLRGKSFNDYTKFVLQEN